MFYQSDIPWLNLCQFLVLIHLTKGIAKLKVLGCRLIFARDGLLVKERLLGANLPS